MTVAIDASMLLLFLRPDTRVPRGATASLPPLTQQRESNT